MPRGDPGADESQLRADKGAAHSTPPPRPDDEPGAHATLARSGRKADAHSPQHGTAAELRSEPRKEGGV